MRNLGLCLCHAIPKVEKAFHLGKEAGPDGEKTPTRRSRDSVAIDL